MKVIAEEAFRCKEIVQKLLSLARPGEEHRAAISLGDVAANVVSLVGGLSEYKNRKVTISANARDDLRVMASEGEMKQVVLNLAINALQSLNGAEGAVAIDVRRDGDAVELAVSDNGRGMSADVIERVFEPFFTAKRGAGTPGTGLGLSISHMIIEKHGGSIVASSGGAGRGSRFVVRLPALEKRA
jgi:signal transduction histidine kinase